VLEFYRPDKVIIIIFFIKFDQLLHKLHRVYLLYSDMLSRKTLHVHFKKLNSYFH
jgi:hypothetical protein